jgi:hypothetical protein
MIQTLEKSNPSKNPIWNFSKWSPLTALIQTVWPVLTLDLWPILTLGPVGFGPYQISSSRCHVYTRNPKWSDTRWPDNWLTRPDIIRNPKWPDTRWLDNRPDLIWPETRNDPTVDDLITDPTRSDTTQNLKWPGNQSDPTWYDPILDYPITNPIRLNQTHDSTILLSQINLT